MNMQFTEMEREMANTMKRCLVSQVIGKIQVLKNNMQCSRQAKIKRSIISNTVNSTGKHTVIYGRWCAYWDRHFGG